MVRKNPYRPFVPDPEQMALWPDLSGNAVNGLGETAPRPARMVYWAPDPGDIPHGDLQLYFYAQSARDPRFAEARVGRQAVLDAPLPAVADQTVARSQQDWSTGLATFVADGVCELIGVAAIDPDWIVDGHDITLPRVIMLGVHHDYDALKTAPDAVAGLDVMEQYRRAALGAKSIAGWLRTQGWQADPLTGPMTGALTMIPPALACGFGELGKHGSIINPDLGAAFRLSAVLTDAPLPVTPAQNHGIDGFCQNCRICEDACPPQALSADKQTVRGADKWYVDFDKCLPFFNQHHGCAICIAVCPWSLPGVGPNLAAKLARRAHRNADS
ncbi:4Fe-4S dicluster domain-containing protein [Rhodobacteraceae bacterium M382]|nr:4Fe-4S dicluster domain-containing protein [Rhodobacteraceae bacterium M382]